MKICLIFLSGKNKGKIQCFISSPVSLGTGKDNVFKFDSSSDRKVSMEHAVIFEEDDSIYISDLGSKSGTYVNAEKVKDKMVLQDWDVIELGKGGTKMVFRLNETPRVHPGSNNVLEEEMMKIINSSLLKIKGKKSGRLDPATVFFRKVIDKSVKKSTRRFKILTSILTIFLVVAIGLWIAQTIRESERQKLETERRIAEINAAWENRLESMEEKNELFSETTASREAELRSRIAELEEQLEDKSVRESNEGVALRKELRRVQRELDKTRNELMRNSRVNWVKIAQDAQNSVVLIANYYQIYDKNSGKPLMVTGKDPNGKPIIKIGGKGTPLRFTATGSGFNVDPEGIFFTNKHVIKPWETEKFFIQRNLIGKTLRLQLIFADTSEWIECNIHKESEEHDIVVLKLKNEKNNKYPYIDSFEKDTLKLKQGEEIAVIGFPGNVKTDGKAVTTLTVGVLSKVALKTDLQFNAQINPGNSGGPLLNSAGKVIGIVYGAGVGTTGERLQGISYAIPIKLGLDLL